MKRLRLELEGEGSQNQGVLSPTANLPNLVRDGLNRSSRTPTSARKKGAAPSDWLTNLSREDQMTYGINSINIISTYGNRRPKLSLATNSFYLVFCDFTS